MEVEAFTRRYYELCGAQVQEAAPGLILVSIGPDAVKVTDNIWTPPYQLLLGFTREAVEAHPEAELVAPGSFRLDRIIAAVAGRGRLARAYLPPADPTSARRAVESWYRSRTEAGRFGPGLYFLSERCDWEPYLAMHISAAAVGEGREETFLLSGVNLVTGGLVRDLSPLILPGCPASPQSPGKERRRKVPFRRAYAMLIDDAKRWVADRESGWAAETTRRFEEESRRLEEFYDGLAHEARLEDGVAQALTETKRRRLEEQRDRFSPRVLIRPCAAAVLFVPVVSLTVLVSAKSGDDRQTLVYDPVIRGIRPASRSPHEVR